MLNLNVFTEATVMKTTEAAASVASNVATALQRLALYRRTAANVVQIIRLNVRKFAIIIRTNVIAIKKAA